MRLWKNKNKKVLFISFFIVAIVFFIQISIGVDKFLYNLNIFKKIQAWDWQGDDLVCCGHPKTDYICVEWETYWCRRWRCSRWCVYNGTRYCCGNSWVEYYQCRRCIRGTRVCGHTWETTSPSDCHPDTNCITTEDGYRCCETVSDGPCEGGGPPPNHPPSCSIEFPADGGSSNVYYDAKHYYGSNGTVKTEDPTARKGKINTSDSDGDNVTITEFTADKNCVDLQRNGNNFNLTPRGYLDGITPQLTGSNVCKTTLTAKVSDGHATRTCTKDVNVYYYQTTLENICINDVNKNSSGKDLNGGEANNLPELNNDFTFVGSTAPDPTTYTIYIQNEGSVTQTLEAVENRFTKGEVLMSDKAPFKLRLQLKDLNGPLNMALANARIYLKNNNTGFKLRLLTTPSTTSGVVYHYPIDTYGIKSDESVVIYHQGNDWEACLNDHTTIACIRGEIYHVTPINTVDLIYEVYPKNERLPDGPYQIYFANGDTVNKDNEKVSYIDKGNNLLQDRSVSLLDNNTKTYYGDNCNNVWSKQAYLFLDSHPPVVTVDRIERIDSQTLDLYVTLSDNGQLLSNPIYRTYVFATNEQSGNVEGIRNRFLSNDLGVVLKAEDTILDTKNYNWQFLSKNGNNYFYKLRIKGVLGGDNITYGFCVADAAGNERCCDSDGVNQAGCNLINQGSHVSIGDNWIRTSLGYLYSGGGFANLPNYGAITDVYEFPEGAAEFINPFNSVDRAVLSTFGAFSYVHNLGHVDFGYNNKHKDTFGVNHFYKSGISFREADWKAFLQEVASLHCDFINYCDKITVTNGVELEQALQAKNPVNNSEDYYKIIEVDTAANELTLPKQITIHGKNIVFVNNATIRLYEIYEPNKFSDKDTGVIFVASNGAQIIIDDDKDLDFDGSDTDLVQAGFIILGDATFKEVQGLASGNRDAYIDSGGDFDRLILHGFVYSQSLPVLERDLGIDRNEHYPSEWIIYDTRLLQLFAPLWGRRKLQAIDCNVIQSPVCSTN